MPVVRDKTTDDVLAENDRLRTLLRDADTVFQIYEREATGRLLNAMADIPMRIRKELTHT